jgi:C_GCAxxG_C_C family probable redox protein
MERSKYAVSLLQSGLNCAQSVLLTFSDECGMSEDTGIASASGFGAGIARLQETCGAVTGAVMVIGSVRSLTGDEHSDLKELIYSDIQKFTSEFIKHNGSIKCSELTGCNLSTDAGREYFDENKLLDTVCSKCVGDSVEILEQILSSGN